MKKKKIACCMRTRAIVEQKSNSFIDYNDIPLYYSPSIRTFFITLCSKINEHKGGNFNCGYFIKVCPWCGSKFPKGLADEKVRILTTEYKHTEHDDSCWIDNSCFPPEFQTDEWWKKRGL